MAFTPWKAFVLFAAASCGTAHANEVDRFVIRSDEDFEIVEAAIQASEAAAVVVTVKEGVYRIKDTFRINRSCVSLMGEGRAQLVLEKGVNKPVVAIGTQAKIPEESQRIREILIDGIWIDGQKDFQGDELDVDMPWIRNNGIDVRRVDDLTVRNATCSNARSGGLVISWGCNRVFVEDSHFERNYFDGVAYYDSVDVVTSDCVMRLNRSAGISIDNNLRDTAFVRCNLVENGDVGVFARNSHGIRFTDCAIQDNGNWAMFLAHDDRGLGVYDATIEACHIMDNNGGIRLASEVEAQSCGIKIAGTFFEGNEVNGRTDVSSAGITYELINLAAKKASISIEALENL